MSIKSLLCTSAILASTAGVAFAETEVQWWHAMGGANGERDDQDALLLP